MEGEIGGEGVERMSSCRQRKSLSETARLQKQREKTANNANKTSRTNVINPRILEWPEVRISDKKELMELTQSLITALKLPSRKVPLNEIRKVEKSDRAQFRRQWSGNEAEKAGYQISTYIATRSSLALGVNCVSKALELGLLAAVIIDKDVNPPIITKLLVPIAESKNVPIVAVNGLNTIFMDQAGMRCIAFGLKKQCDQLSHHFQPLVQLVRTICDQRNSTNEQDSLELMNESVSTTELGESFMDTTLESPNVPIKKSGKRKTKKRTSHTPAKIRKIT